MSDTISLKVDTRALEQALLNLPQRLAGKVMRNALQAAGDVLLASMVAHAPERTDEEMPDSTSLPPGILKADLTTQIRVGTSAPPSVRVGPTKISGRVARWQNNGYNLKRGKKGKSQMTIRAIPGKHFMEASFDESSSAAVNVFVDTLAQGLGQDLSDEGVGPEIEYGGENY